MLGRMAVPVAPSRGPRPSGRLSGAQRLTLIAWTLLALTVCGVVYVVLLIQLLGDVGNGMACFDGDGQACAANPVGLADLWLPLVAGSALVALAAVAVVVARRHSRGSARRATAVAVLGVSVTLNCVAGLALVAL